VNEPPGPHDPDGKVIRALLAACPSFAEPWREHVESSNGRIGAYVDAGAFASHLVDLLEADRTSELADVFDVVERFLIDGDDGIRYLVTFGLIEDVQNISSNRHDWAFAARFREWLRPTTTTAWDEVHRVWGTSDPGSDRGDVTER
jgi:hypothetical protein